MRSARAPNFMLGLSVSILTFITVHTYLFYYDLRHPDAFLEGDRAGLRLGKLHALDEAIFNKSIVTDLLLEKGDPGDFVFYYPAYAIGEQSGIIIFQLLLNLIGIIFLYRLAHLLFKSTLVSIITTITYILLPSTLLQTHILVTEALFNPLMIITFYYSAVYFYDKGFSLTPLLLAGVTATIAISIRLVFVLYPLLLFILLLFAFNRRSPIKYAAYLVTSYLLPFIWVMFVLISTGHFSYGHSDHSLSLNLHGRVTRMSNIGSFELKPEHRASRELTLSQYLLYIHEHPGAFLKTVLSDASNIFLNSGINSFAGRYLSLYNIQPHDVAYWRRIRDTEGLWQMINHMRISFPHAYVTNIAASILWFAIVALAIAGVCMILKDISIPLGVRLSILIYPIYIIVGSFFAISVRFGHRTPIDFILCLGFALTVAKITRWGQVKLSNDSIIS